MGRWTSYVLTGIFAVGLALLAVLALRVAWRMRGPGARRRLWVHALRTLLVGVVAGGLWVVLPPLLTSARMPAPFGGRGYPFDVLVALIVLLGVPTAWTAVPGDVDPVGSWAAVDAWPGRPDPSADRVTSRRCASTTAPASPPDASPGSSRTRVQGTSTVPATPA